jgi:hypothetical protein
VIAFILLYLIDDCGNQATKTKLICKMLLACLRNIMNFWSKMTIKHSNELNVELKITEKVTAFLKIEEAAKRDSSNGQLDQLQRRCQFF